MKLYLVATDCYIDLTAALVRTVEHLEHPVCLDDGASPVSLWPDTAKTHDADLVHGKWRISAADLCWAPQTSNLHTYFIMQCVYVGSWPAQTPLQLSVTSQLQSVISGLQQLFVAQTCRETVWKLMTHERCPPSAVEEWVLKDLYQSQI